MFENSLLCKYSSYRNIYTLMTNINKRRNKGKIMFHYDSKYLAFTLKVGRVYKYALQTNYTSPIQNVQNIS